MDQQPVAFLSLGDIRRPHIERGMGLSGFGDGPCVATFS